MTTLRDLPIRPTFTEDVIRENYVTELKEATDVPKLRAFLDRWNAIFRLNHQGRMDLEPYVKLGDKTYTDEELAEALECMKKCKKGACEHCVTGSHGCIGVNILVPPLLISAEIAGNHFGVSTDLAIIQMNGGMGELDDF